MRSQININWKKSIDNFRPRMKLLDEKNGSVPLDVGKDSTELDIFMKIFARRMNMSRDKYEIMVVLGCTMVMSYNRKNIGPINSHPGATVGLRVFGH